MFMYSFGMANEDQLASDLHAAILPVIERVFHERWRLLAGQKSERLGTRRMPKKWTDL